MTTPATEPITTPATEPITTPITEPITTPETTSSAPEDSVNQEGSALEEILKPAQITLLRPIASGDLVKSNASAIIDYSHIDDGYIMVNFTGTTSARLKVQVTGPTTTYTYNISAQEWVVFPLSDGNGDYRLKVLKNVVDTRYSTVLSLSFTVSLKDEFAPFLRPNQYVNYENAINSMNKAAELVSGKKSLLEKVEAIYSYVIKNISYDYDKAATVESDYLPVLDDVLASGKGICFDYASLMTGMLRSQNIACKLVVGYADGAYHAWINVWSPDEGWINGSIFFDGVDWKLMDPTFAAGGSEPSGVKYTSKYIY
ncbi:MAG: transglutaminase domain-containing protein [Clostridia bacterium]|nr:transglutaminase domain-containing protein [Clostridia bacterium]